MVWDRFSTIVIISRSNRIWIITLEASTWQFTCTQCSKGCTCSLNLEMHMLTCTSGAAAVAAVGSSTPAHRGGAANVPVQRSSFAGEDREHLVVPLKCMDMQKANQLDALEVAVGELEC